MSDLVKLAIIGDGKMGKAVAALAPASGFEIVAMLGEADTAAEGITAALLNNAQVAIEFTVPASAAGNIRACVAAGCPVVSGTTGWGVERIILEKEIAVGTGALLWAPNFSIGVHLFAKIVEYASELITKAGAGFDAHQIETHHKAKVDAPSGTAKMLADAAARGLGHELPTTSVRTGSVPGTHQIVFDAAFETICLEHIARDRSVFAAGALTAAKWLVGKQGVFTLDHLLGTNK